MVNFILEKLKEILKLEKNEHINDALNPNRDHYYIHNSINFYGVENFIFEIIFQCKEIEILNWAENYFIVLNNSINKKVGFNLTFGGDGGKISEETRLKMSKSKLGEKNSFYGKQHSEEIKKHLSEIKTGTNMGEDNHFYGKTHSEQSLMKMKENHHNKEKYLSDEQCENIRKEYIPRINTHKMLAIKYDVSSTIIKNVINFYRAYAK